ncbi:MAG: hypothetical protein H8D47_04535 [Planctomycetes bacterium]|nr:hypothetical protein [Planctomycetota bacterium]
MFYKNLKFLVIFLLLTGPYAFGEEAELLREDAIIAGVPGKLVSDANGGWLFSFDQEVSDGIKAIEAGKPLALLECSTLEKILYIHQQDPNSQFRLWARVTTYEERNYLYSAYFLEIAGTEESDTELAEANEPNMVVEIEEANDSNQPAESVGVIDEGEDEFKIPEKVLRKLRPQKIVRTQEIKKLRKGLKLKQDMIMANRTGFINKTSSGGYEFVIGGGGRGIGGTRFLLVRGKGLGLFFEGEET